MEISISSKRALVAKALLSLSKIDFEMLKLKLQDSEEGLGWSPEECDIAELDYKRFLALKYAYPDEEVVPNQTVDKFWHYHILDTKAYARDCEQVFGYFVHHFPYFGMRGEQDLRDLHIAFADTTALYMQHFGEGYDSAKGGGRGKCRTACKPVKCK
ncbi:glycine-rich domain-containing protein [Pontibacter cellulosilyticus]|uniref:Glycine-rich domain-containing protein-like n=1 Tax=Pontibacter cellulosilyticus TaxID=1720253 RepID=A0A923SPC8_9BACT|nr:hypothetical protein [Pontibacter cellulosilyticus]MBC5994015.1 hypothetical protein [Pontibacter cellulosilyticus]